MSITHILAVFELVILERLPILFLLND